MLVRCLPSLCCLSRFDGHLVASPLGRGERWRSLGVSVPLFPLAAEAHEEDEGDPTSFLLSFAFSDWTGLGADLFFSFMFGLLQFFSHDTQLIFTYTKT